MMMYHFLFVEFLKTFWCKLCHGSILTHMICSAMTVNTPKMLWFHLWEYHNYLETTGISELRAFWRIIAKISFESSLFCWVKKIQCVGYFSVCFYSIWSLRIIVLVLLSKCKEEGLPCLNEAAIFHSHVSTVTHNGQSQRWLYREVLWHF